jgi:hypothetical protein
VTPLLLRAGLQASQERHQSNAKTHSGSYQLQDVHGANGIESRIAGDHHEPESANDAGYGSGPSLGHQSSWLGWAGREREVIRLPQVLVSPFRIAILC